VETSETIILNYTLSPGSTDAKTGTENQTYTFTITDNDIAPHGVLNPVATLGSGNVKLTQPFRGEMNDSRTQILLTSAELMAAGLFDGSIAGISEIALNVLSKQSTVPYSNFTIKMKNTTTTFLPGGGAPFESGATIVFGPVTYSTVAGVNNFVLTSPFSWDSTQN